VTALGCLDGRMIRYKRGLRGTGATVRVIRTAAVITFLLLSAVEARAEQRWAVIISGASGGAKYAEQMREWRTAIADALVDRYGFARDKVSLLVDETVKSGEQGTADNVRKLVGELRKQVSGDDLVLIVLLGHGTFDGDAAKFNLVGRDLTAAEWGALLKGMPGRLALVNTTAASYPFLEHLSGPDRVIITATDSVAQKYATVFPQYFVKALGEASSDLDKNGQTSLFEVFAATSAAVKQHYEQRGQLTTERAVLDDNGDRIGREAEAPGPDGGLARLFYLDAPTAAAANDPELAALLKQRRTLEAQAEALKARKGAVADPAWQAEYEQLMIELAKVSRAIRERS
jgi:hypothetical protein